MVVALSPHLTFVCSRTSVNRIMQHILFPMASFTEYSVLKLHPCCLGICSRHFIQTESCTTWPFVSGIFYFACVQTHTVSCVSISFLLLSSIPLNEYNTLFIHSHIKNWRHFQVVVMNEAALKLLSKSFCEHVFLFLFFNYLEIRLMVMRWVYVELYMKLPVFQNLCTFYTSTSSMRVPVSHRHTRLHLVVCRSIAASLMGTKWYLIAV